MDTARGHSVVDNMIRTSACTYYRGNISSKFFRYSEAYILKFSSESITHGCIHINISIPVPRNYTSVEFDVKISS